MVLGLCNTLIAPTHIELYHINGGNDVYRISCEGSSIWITSREEIYQEPRHSLQNSRLATEQNAKHIYIEYTNEHPEDAK